MSSEITKDKVVAALSGVMDPDFGKDIVSLDLIAGIDISEGRIKVEVKSSNPALHARKRMQDAVEFALERAFGSEVKTKVNVGTLPAEERTSETRKILPGVKNIIAVASGKVG